MTGMIILPLSARLVVLAATENMILFAVLLTVIAEKPAGLLMLPMVKSVILEFPEVIVTLEVKDTALGIMPLLSEVNTWLTMDCVMVYDS